MYNFNTEILETHEAQITVEVEEQALQNAIQQAARTIARTVQIPGFRKGRAPFARILRYVGEERMREEAVDGLLEELYPQAIKTADITPYAHGDIEEITYDPCVIKIRVPLAPEVELGDYKSLRREWEDATVAEDEIETVLEQIQEEHAVESPVERPCQYGDLVYLDVLGTVDEEEVLIDEENSPFYLDEEEEEDEEEFFFTPEFYDELIGLQAGDEKTFVLTLPEDIDEEDLRNKEVTYDVVVNEVLSYTLPDIDDALATTVGAFETLEELKADIRARLLEFKRMQQESVYQDALLDALIEQAQIRFPPQMLEETLEELLADAEQHMQQDHKISLEDALRMDGRTLEQFREEMSPRARTRLMRSLALSEFMHAEQIQVTDDDVLNAYHELLESFGTDTETAPPLDFHSELGQNLRQSALGEKVFARLMAIGRGEVIEAPAEEAPAETPALPETA